MKTNYYPRILLFLFILLFTAGCGTRKVEKEKKVEKISLLEHKDVKTSEKIKIDVSTVKVLDNQNLKFTPVDKDFPSQVIYGKDTLTFLNSSVEVNNTKSTETTRDNTVKENNSNDRSITGEESVTRESSRNSESKRSNTGLLIGFSLAILAVVIIWYFRKKIPFL